MVLLMQGKQLIIVGAGVAGTIAALLTRRRLGDASGKIVVYEASKRYRKPCGEAVPSWILKVVEEHGISLPKILYRLRVHVFDVAGVCKRTIEDVEWVIIDKKSWIEELRRRIEDVIVYQAVSVESVANNTNNIVFDARGPFVGDKALWVWQSYAECSHSDSAMLRVTVNPFGLVWVFPRGKSICNIGGGFVNVKELHKLREVAVNEVRRIIDVKTFVSENYSIIRVPPSNISVFRSPNIVRLGEAAGLIMSLGGEGIRAALLSAIAAASATSLENETICFNKLVYVWKIKNLILQSWLQKKLFEVIKWLTAEKICELLKAANEDVLRMWFEGRLGLWEVLFGVPKIVFIVFS